MLFIFVLFFIRFYCSHPSFNCVCYHLSDFLFLLTCLQISLRELKKTTHCQVVPLLTMIFVTTVMRHGPQDHGRVTFPHSGDCMLLGLHVNSVLACSSKTFWCLLGGVCGVNHWGAAQVCVIKMLSKNEQEKSFSEIALLELCVWCYSYRILVD